MNIKLLDTIILLILIVLLPGETNSPLAQIKEPERQIEQNKPPEAVLKEIGIDPAIAKLYGEARNSRDASIDNALVAKDRADARAESEKRKNLLLQTENRKLKEEILLLKLRPDCQEIDTPSNLLPVIPPSIKVPEVKGRKWSLKFWKKRVTFGSTKKLT